jgi:uncharacterized protein YlzI (FlbEa/FlbD family)
MGDSELLLTIIVCIEASLGCIQVCLENMEACPDATVVCLEKMEAVLKVSQEEVRAKIRTGLEELKATESEANQEKTVEHCRREPCMCILPCRTP